MSCEGSPTTWGDVAARVDALHDAYFEGRRAGVEEAQKRAEIELSSVSVWQWVRFDGMDGLSEWMPAKRTGKYWSSVGWGNCIPEVYGPLIFTPKDSPND